MVACLLDQGVLSEPPVFRDGAIQNIEELGGYGPFLMVAHQRDAQGHSIFPDTFEGGLGMERVLWGILRGPCIRSIEDVTCFGKNPDSQPLYLF